jgi:capsular polysaccharide biosynthesis protein
MATANLKQQLLYQLKRLGWLYTGARWLHHRFRRLFFNLLAECSSSCMRLGPVRGVFGAYDALKAKQLSGEIISEGQPVISPGADSLRIRAKLGQERYQPWPIFWTRHDDARLAGRTALLRDERKRVPAEAVYLFQQENDPGYESVWLPPPTRLDGNWTSLISRWTVQPNYYHWFMDGLPRLALLDRLPADTKILVPSELRPFQTETLRWLGLEQRIVPLPGRHLVAEHFYFSSPTVMTGCADPYGVRFLREKFLPRAEPPVEPVEKIYIQRRGKTRGLVNEAELLSFLEARGWRAMDLESLTLAQQIGLFTQARAVCGLHGAGFTNLLWCQPGTVAVELLADNFLNGCFESLASCVAVEHRFLIYPADHQNRIHVDLKDLARYLPD